MFSIRYSHISSFTFPSVASIRPFKNHLSPVIKPVKFYLITFLFNGVISIKLKRSCWGTHTWHSYFYKLKVLFISHYFEEKIKFNFKNKNKFTKSFYISVFTIFTIVAKIILYHKSCHEGYSFVILFLW